MVQTTLRRFPKISASKSLSQQLPESWIGFVGQHRRKSESNGVAQHRSHETSVSSSVAAPLSAARRAMPHVA